MELLMLVGRVMFGVLFLAAALGHLTQTNAMSDFVESRGVPNAHLATQASGVAILLGGISVMLGVYADVGALVLFVFLIGTAVLVHRFWNEPEGEQRTMVQTQFMKDLALAGAALVMFAVFAEADDRLGYMLTGSVF